MNLPESTGSAWLLQEKDLFGRDEREGGDEAVSLRFAEREGFDEAKDKSDFTGEVEDKADLGRAGFTEEEAEEMVEEAIVWKMRK